MRSLGACLCYFASEDKIYRVSKKKSILKNLLSGDRHAHVPVRSQLED